MKRAIEYLSTVAEEDWVDLEQREVVDIYDAKQAVKIAYTEAINDVLKTIDNRVAAGTEGGHHLLALARDLKKLKK